MIRVERRPKYADRLDGFVVGVGAKWALLAQISDGGFFDGFVAFRLRDIERLRDDKSFQSAYARTQPEWPPVAPAAVGLDGTAEVIESLSGVAPLIGVQKEHKRWAIWIGAVDEMAGGFVYLWEVRSDATWHLERRRHKLRAITTVEIGTRYLTGLAAIAGSDPRRYQK